MCELKEDRNVSFEEKPPFPQNMLVELTNACNHSCAFCGYKSMDRKRRYADKEFTLDIIKQAYENGTRDIGFYVIGEPFLSNELQNYVAFSKKLGFSYIYLTTNGALASIEKMKNLIGAGLDSIKFSVNGATREVYEKVHGQDDFQTVFQNIADLRAYLDANQTKLKTFLSFVQCDLNKHQTDSIVNVFSKYVDKVYVYKMYNAGGSININQDKKSELGEYSLYSLPCEMVFNRLHITAEGYLDACCTDYEGKLVIADLHKMSLTEAWNSEEFVKLRRCHLNKQVKGLLCYNCVTHSESECHAINSSIVFEKQRG